MTGQRHGREGVSVPVPAGWTESAAAPEALAALVADYRPARFTPNIVVTAHELEPGESPAEWVERALPLLAEELPLLHLIDSCETEVAGRPGHRALSHYPLAEFGGVTVEQWFTTDGGRGLVLACSVGTLEYDDAADHFAEVAAGLEIGTAR